MSPKVAAPRSFHIWTIGCQMNTADSESLARSLLAAGYVEETDIERADIAVLNTCVVRQASEEKVYGKLHELRSWKTPERTIAVTGCIVRKEGDTLQQRFPQLDRVVPIGEYRDFVAELDARYDISQGEPLPVAGRTGISAYVSIIEGCDHNCTFCIVPAVRGRERHKPGSQVLSEVRAAVGEGAREVVLLGQNVDDYRDPETGAGLAALLRRLETVEGLRRLRFMTSHPQDLEMELLDVMAGSRVIAHELQLPIQSGSDTMLKRMARGYQVRHYRAIIERARRLMPDLGLATDIIVGFPGETEAMFEDTLRVMRDLQFDVVHLAQYSPRPGTHAARAMTDDVPAEEKRRRINVALALQKEIAAFRTSRFVGRTVEVLVQGRDELGRPYGRNRQGKRVLVKRASVHPGELVQVLVEDSGPGQLAGPLAGARPELSLTSRA